MRRGILLVVIGGALTLGCGRHAGSYAPPPQRSLDLGRDPGTLGPFVLMDDPLADEYIVRDISPDRGHHRWAFVHPELKFRVEDARHLKLIAEFAIPEVTFKVTGPVTVSCAVNGHSLGSIRCDHAGDFRLEKAVPDGVVKPGEDAHVTFEAQPRWVSPEDRAELSFFLRSVGLTQ